MINVHTMLRALLFSLWIASATSQTQFRWCTVSNAEKTKCEDMAGNFTRRRLSPPLECVQARHRYECMRWIRDDRADLVRVDDKDLFAAGEFYNLAPIVAEKYNTVQNQAPFRYKAVALIKANGPITSLETLRGRKSCHTGIGKTSGWIVPLANLVAMRLMTARNCAGNMKAVADFFGESCVPGAKEPANNPYGDNPDSVCALCQNPSACSEADVYSGYLGAFRCLHEGGGDVAFVTHTTLDDARAYYANRRLPRPDRADFRLLCPDGRVDDVDNWESCSWATRPSNTIVTSANKPDETSSLYRSMLVRAVQFFGARSREFRMFSSADYGESDLLFTDRTRALVGLNPADGYRQLMDDGYLRTFYNYTNCGTTLRWCVDSSGGEEKCRDMRAAFTANRITRALSCVRRDNSQQCLEAIDQNQADLYAAGSGDVYNGGRYHNAVPIASESTDASAEGVGGYWSVAVARESDTEININNLQGKSSCHTGIGKSVGWNVPVGMMASKGEISDDPCNIAESVGNFFSRSCVPGALDTRYNPNGTNPETMCALCGGRDKCMRNSSNPYYSYIGAFRCFVVFNADVAFIDPTTVLQNTDGRSTFPWARNRRSRDYVLLCPDGTRQPVTNWQNCNLGRVPPHAVVVKRDNSPDRRRYFYMVLDRAQVLFGNDSNGKFALYDSPRGSSNRIFKDDTVTLQWLSQDQQTYQNYIGEQYTDTLRLLDTNQCTSPSKSQKVHCSPILIILVAVMILSRFV